MRAREQVNLAYLSKCYRILTEDPNGLQTMCAVTQRISPVELGGVMMITTCSLDPIRLSYFINKSILPTTFCHQIVEYQFNFDGIVSECFALTH